MSVGRYRLLSDLKLQLRKELGELTATSAANPFPETRESFNGVDQRDLFSISAYMEARFYILEALFLLETIIKRDIRLEDIDFILEHGALPVVTRHTDDFMHVPKERSAGIVTRLSKLLRGVDKLLKNIINDHPRRLNLYAYFLIQTAFFGDMRGRLIRLEKIVFRLILDRHLQHTNYRKCPRIIQWLALTAKDLLRSNPERISLSDLLRLRAIVDISERWPRLVGEEAENFEVHFTVYPQLLYRNFTRPHLAGGMMTVEASDIKGLCIELFEQVLLKMSWLLSREPAQRSKIFGLMLRHAHHRARKFIKSTTEKHDISSIVQLKRDLPLLPPCIYQLIARLQRDNRLPNVDRTYLLVFLKNIGLPMLEAEGYFRNTYNKNVDPSLTWITRRAGHLRRVYRDKKRSQLRCEKFDRYCVWRCGSDHDARKMLVKIRNGQVARDKNSGLWCPVGDFQKLLRALGNVPNANDARAHCAKLGCFQDSELPFFSPLGYYYNTKAASITGRETDDHDDSSSDDSLSW